MTKSLQFTDEQDRVPYLILAMDPEAVIEKPSEVEPITAVNTDPDPLGFIPFCSIKAALVELARNTHPSMVLIHEGGLDVQVFMASGVPGYGGGPDNGSIQ